jgi:Fic family protein
VVAADKQLIDMLLAQKRAGVKGNVYWKTQIDFAYNSNRIEGSRLTKEQTRYIYETKTIDGEASIDDVAETANHFRMFDYMLDHLDDELSVESIQEYHRILKTGTSQAYNKDFNTGGWKLLQNAVGDIETTPPQQVDAEIRRLLDAYNDFINDGKTVGLEQIAAFHVAFERIHPFLDGNGRTGRIIMFAQCLQNNVGPFIVLDADKLRYYKGLSGWYESPSPLIDFFKDCQGLYKKDVLYLAEQDAGEFGQDASSPVDCFLKTLPSKS